MAGEVREPEVEAVTIVGRVVPLDSDSYMKLCYLAHEFRRHLAKAYHHGVGVVVFEDLDKIKLRAFTRSPTANRKMTRFPKKKLVQHGVVMALKYGFKVYLVNPAHTSTIGEVLGKELGLDKHTASAYTLVLRYLGIEPKTLEIPQVAKKTKTNHPLYSQR